MYCMYVYKRKDAGNVYLLMDLTKSEAEGWRIRSRKSCQVRGAVDELNTSPFSISEDRSEEKISGAYKVNFLPFSFRFLFFFFRLFLAP